MKSVLITFDDILIDTLTNRKACLELWPFNLYIFVSLLTNMYYLHQNYTDFFPSSYLLAHLASVVLTNKVEPRTRVIALEIYIYIFFLSVSAIQIIYGFKGTVMHQDLTF